MQPTELEENDTVMSQINMQVTALIIAIRLCFLFAALIALELENIWTRLIDQFQNYEKASKISEFGNSSILERLPIPKIQS